MSDKIEKDTNELNNSTNTSYTSDTSGIRPIKPIWCKFCKTANDHHYWECKEVYCNICYCKGHIAKYCKYANACQWCGSIEHTSNCCDSPEGLLLKASSFRRCARCQRYGHIAKDCHAIPKRRGRPYFKK